MRIYIASSWRNQHQQGVVVALREAGHDVYDFRHPKPGNDGFSWAAIDPDWMNWTPEQFRDALAHPIAKAGFELDDDALSVAEATVLVLPCGRSAHLELGFACAHQLTYVLMLEPSEPELMYKLTSGGIVLSIEELIEALEDAQADLDDNRLHYVTH